MPKAAKRRSGSRRTGRNWISQTVGWHISRDVVKRIERGEREVTAPFLTFGNMLAARCGNRFDSPHNGRLPRPRVQSQKIVDAISPDPNVLMPNYLCER